MKDNKRSLGDRMKEYENSFKYVFPIRMPLIIRIDGKAFHTFTRKMKRPFDLIFSESMKETSEELVKNIQGCKLAYTQSDEISLLLTDYDTLNTESWFRKELQKIVSVSASMATLFFNNSFGKNAEISKDNVYLSKINKAMFDSRAFILPENEVCNYFIWRQKDSERNSVNMLAQSIIPHKELQNLSVNEVQNVLLRKHNVNWNNTPTRFKRGICVTKKEAVETDLEIPVFTEERNYINQFVFLEGD